LLSILSGGQHLTAVYICLDHNKSVLHLVNAAHLPVLFMPKKGEPQWLSVDGDVLGAFNDAHFSCQSFPLSGGERFFAFSDGLLESFEGQARSREQGMRELSNFAIKTRALEIQEAATEITRLMFEHGRRKEDDVVLLGVDV